MPDMPLVSIAAINYNNSKFLIETLESIRNQTYPNIELIIVDDCSTDNSVDVINNWLRNYTGKYKFIRHETNKGVCVGCNSGLKNATGKYFSIIATDDLLVPEKTEKQVMILEASNAKVAAVYSDAYVIDEVGVPIEGFFIQRFRQFAEIPSGDIYDILLQGNYIPGMAFLFKTSVFEDVGYYDESLVYEDFDMWLRIAQKYNFIFSDFASAMYRIRQGSLTSTIKNWSYSDLKIYLKHTDAALPAERLKNIAKDAYDSGDKTSMPLVNELAKKINNSYLKTIYLLWKFGISQDIGEKILARQSENIVGGASSGITDGQADLKIFVDQICGELSLELLKGISRDTYCSNTDERLLITSFLANKMKYRYFRTVYLLCYFQIPVAFGEAILEKERKYVDSGLLPEIREGDYTHIVTFTEQISGALPLESMKSIACEAYSRNVPDRMILIRELGRKTNSRYFRTAYLLCEFGVSPAYGEKILANKKEYISTHFSTNMKKGDYADMAVFITQVVTALPTESLQEIASNAYFADFVDAMEFVNALATKTKNRYLRAVSLLWKTKVAISKGKAILSGLEKSPKSGSSWATDLSLYKDILFTK